VVGTVAERPTLATVNGGRVAWAVLGCGKGRRVSPEGPVAEASYDAGGVVVGTGAMLLRFGEGQQVAATGCLCFAPVRLEVTRVMGRQKAWPVVSAAVRPPPLRRLPALRPWRRPRGRRRAVQRRTPPVTSTSSALAKLDFPLPLRPTTKVKPDPGENVSDAKGPMPRKPATCSPARYALASVATGPLSPAERSPWISPPTAHSKASSPSNRDKEEVLRHPREEDRHQAVYTPRRATCRRAHPSSEAPLQRECTPLGPASARRGSCSHPAIVPYGATSSR
jgi:hypothetical protein